ncbi:MAG: GntR family transcriptional regulator [Rhizobiales bacterium]|nr:GntR family transcriptional regulator [Hyphomicrobiales bacterium]MBI3672027.1 GntR family transcriptional regulator [Hyphomicrobiales bacterium]
MARKSSVEKQSANGGAAPKRHGQSDERIYREIYAAIIDHQIAPGTALQEEELATAFGVSRTVIRKVLQKLAHARLVDLVPNKGASVAKPSAEEAREVFDARRAIESVLVERVVAGASDEGIGKLLKLAKTERLAFESGNKQGRVKLSGDFHRQLAMLAGNAVLAGFLTELVSRTSLIIALYESPGAVSCSHGEHLEIAQAIKRRDAKKAVQYMVHHLQHIEAQIELSDQHARVDFKSLFKPAV